ncbi:porin [Quatrionicoccus australiensis]|uniref:porin n=1 Tax=Quatrionicoccus australiensis TaxID=138118 RepID=UPI001CF92077|nr:porin [Quatrionicoccus australiensis]UCV14578.1 porin [Quatrionicoccus australiensis]
MQKKIIAVAVAALASTAAFAQTNVTVYGVVDVQQAFVKSSGVDGANQGSVGRLDSHGNYIGFKGVEDLGNGLKAVFVYESAFSADAGAALSGGRDSYIGLAGGFGTVAAGNLTHPLRAFGAKVELLPGAAGFGTTASVTGTLVGIKTGADDRAANAVAYISPSFSGFTVIGAYVNGEVKTNEADVQSWAIKGSTGVNTLQNTVYKGTNSKQYQIAGQYENGPLFVGAGYHKAKDLLVVGKTALGDLALAEDGQDARVYRVVAAYTFPTNTKVTALYDNTKVETGDHLAGLTSYLKRSAASVGVAQTFGKNTIGLEYAKSFKLKTDGGKVDGTSSNIITAMYGYELSKRTMLHARVSRLNNGENVNNNFYNLPVANGVSTTYGSDYTGFSVGLRHSF